MAKNGKKSQVKKSEEKTNKKFVALKAKKINQKINSGSLLNK